METATFRRPAAGGPGAVTEAAEHYLIFLNQCPVLNSNDPIRAA